MSFDSAFLSTATGIVASVLAAAGLGFVKNITDKQLKRKRDRVQETARTRLTEFNINVAGLGLKYQIEQNISPETEVATKLLKEVEQGIVEGVSERDGLSREQVRTEVDSRMTDVRGRLEAIEKRFPDDSTIDKIASINDALFAQRIEQLTARIDKFEERLLTKWDVALIVSLVAVGIFTVVGATYAVLKAFGPTLHS